MTKEELTKEISAAFRAFLGEKIIGKPEERKRRRKIELTPGRPVMEEDVRKAEEEEKRKAKKPKTDGRDEVDHGNLKQPADVIIQQPSVLKAKNPF